MKIAEEKPPWIPYREFKERLLTSCPEYAKGGCWCQGCRWEFMGLDFEIQDCPTARRDEEAHRALQNAQGDLEFLLPGLQGPSGQ